jgi:Prophage minor tail protein Z (GPZ)
VSLRFVHELNQLTKDLGKIKECVRRKALPMAANRVTASVKVAAARDLKAVTGYKAGDVKKALIVQKFRPGTQSAAVDATEGRARNLAAGVSAGARTLGQPGTPQFFRRRAKTKGKRYLRPGVKAKAWQGAKVYPGSFIARGRRPKGDSGGGNVIVYSRRRAGRLSKLKGLHGPSVRDEFNKERTQRVMNSKALERMPIELTSAIRQAVRRCGVRV